MAVKTDYARRDALCAWLTANGIDPNDVPIHGDRVIEPGPDDTRMIRYESYIRDDNGSITVDESGNGAAIETRRVPLVVEPPAWWVPFEKPTREQLLARAERVRVLHQRNENTGGCEYCSMRDYPDYAVPFPCDTIRALDGEETQS
jgi:hypothetical protein